MPIVMTSAEWARLVKWTDPNRESAETLHQREYVRRLDEASKQMTKNWPNSVENVKKRNEEMRRARIAIAESANTLFYQRYVKRKKEEQARMLYSARDVVFKNKDAPKQMLSAVLESVVQGDRIAQLKFKEERMAEQRAMKEKNDNEIIRKAAEWHALNETRRRRRFETNKRHQQELVAQAHELSERKRIEHETELEFQKRDNIEGKNQMDMLAKFDAEFKAAEKARIFADMKEARREHAARLEEAAARDKLDDRLIEVLQRSRARVEARRKKTEAEIKAARWKILELVSNRMKSSTEAREAAEQACLLKAVRELDAANEKKIRDERRKREGFAQERRDARAQWLLDEERRLRELDTRRQFEVMNRFKNSELSDQYREEQRLQKARKVKEFKEETLKLWKEREEREARERAETRYFYGELALQKLRHADNQLLTYANALIEEARRCGRPDLPLRRAVQNYCKLYGLYPKTHLPKSLREHFKSFQPWDGSAPDPDYREPTPPPPDRGPDGPDAPPAPAPAESAPALAAPAPPGKRDGLQPANKQAEPSSKAPETHESGADYKRAGRANGLQRRNAQDCGLPPIVVPCYTPTCTCELSDKK